MCLSVCVCVCVAKPVAVELRCHATALIVVFNPYNNKTNFLKIMVLIHVTIVLGRI